MKHIKVIFYRIIIVLSLGLFASCAAEVVAVSPGPGVYIAPGPPPFVGAIWVGGEYRWDGFAHRYVAVEGHWARPRGGRVWAPGHWRPARGGYAWVRGHWR